MEMSDEQRSEVEQDQYEAPAVEDLDSTEGPAVTAAGVSNQ
jgi:hypothetical protein